MKSFPIGRWSIAALWCLGSLSASPGASLIEAVRQAPAVEAALQRSEAALLRAGVAARWANPELEGMLADKETPEDRMPMWAVSLKQPLPKYGERSAARARAQAAQAMAEAEADLLAGETARTAAEAIAAYESAGQRMALLTRQLEQTERTRTAVEARLGTGQGRVSEELALQSRATGLRLALAQEQRRRDDADSELRQQLGLRPDDPRPTFEAPEPDQIQADAAPAQRLVEAQQAEARAMMNMARAEGRPMTSVGVSFEREEVELGNEDTIGVVFMTELPWNSHRYGRAEERAAKAELAGSTAEADALRRRIETDVGQARRLIRLAGETRASVEETQKRVEQEYDALINAAGASGMADGSSVLMLLELLDRSTELAMQSIEAETDARMAQAGLWRYQSILKGELHE